MQKELETLLLQKPNDLAIREEYRNWLRTQTPAMREYFALREQCPEIGFAQWLYAANGLLDFGYYSKRDQEFPVLAKEFIDSLEHRQNLESLKQQVALNWSVFVDTLGQPFERFRFFNNTGNHSLDDDEYPFEVEIGTRGKVVTFENAFCDQPSLSDSLTDDLEFLCDLQLGDCAFGGALSPALPFLYPFKAESADSDSETAQQILDTLQVVRRSCSSATGKYQPGTASENIHKEGFDYVHTNFRNQYIFDVKDVAHQQLKEYFEGEVWYVVVHAIPSDHTLETGRYVILFAVGVSKDRQRLVGVISHQFYHGLLD